MDNKNRIRDLICAIVDDNSLKLENNTELLQSEILDSLGIAQLVAGIETEFNIELDGDDILPENFETVDAINNLIMKYKQN